MKTRLLTIALILISFGLSAQVAINTDDSAPDGSAMLDVKSSNKGMLIPRVDSAARATINSPATGLLVYQNDGLNPGFYFYNGNNWVILNAGTINVPEGDEISDGDGDTKIEVERWPDENWIRFQVKGNQAMVFDSLGNIGIGVDEPKATFHVRSGIKFDSLAPGNIFDSLVTWNPIDSSLRVIPVSSVGGGTAPPVPDPSVPVPIAFQGDTLYVHPTDNANTINYATALSTCANLVAFDKDDWFTPNFLQLDAIYKQSYLLTGLEQYNNWKYWSSSTSGNDDAFTRRMDYGGPVPIPRLTPKAYG